MAQLIDLGGLAEDSGSRRITTGLASNIKSKELIDSLTKAKQIPIDKIKDQIDLDNNKINAYEQLKTLLTKLQDDSKNLKSSSGDNVFSSKITTLMSSTSVAPDNYISIISADNAPNGSYSLSNISLATNEILVNSGTFTSNTASVVAASSTAGMFTAGSFTITGTSLAIPATITLNTGDSLTTVIGKINNQTPLTGVSAIILPVSSTSYSLMLVATSTGTANGFALTDPSNVLSNISFTKTPATDSSFTYNGITVDGSSNEVNFLGINFNISQATPNGTSITINVAPDVKGIVRSVETFIDDYNALLNFNAMQNQRDPKNFRYMPTSYLAGDTSIISAISSIKSEMIKQVSALASTNPNIMNPLELSDVGITLASTGLNNSISNNLLTLDKNILSNALVQKYDSVKKLFQLTFTSDSSYFTYNSDTNALSTSGFRVNLNSSRFASINSYSFADTSSSVVSTTPSAGFFTAGTFTINGVTITLNNGDSLTTIENNINSAGAGVTASINGSGPYTLGIKSNISSGVGTGFDLIDSNSIFINNTNVPITSSSAQTSDIVRLYFDNNDPRFTSIISYGFNDTSSSVVASSSSSGILTAGTFTINGATFTLTAGDSLTTINNHINAQTLSTGVSSNITTNLSGKYVLTLTTSKSNFQLIDLNNIFVNNNNALATTNIYSINATYSPKSGSSLITGISGSLIDGLVMTYGGSGYDTAHITITQGIADRVYNQLYSILGFNDNGIFDSIITSLSTKVGKENTQVDKLLSQKQSYRDFLIKKYSQVEESILKANSVLQLLDAEAAARKAAGS